MKELYKVFGIDVDAEWIEAIGTPTDLFFVLFRWYEQNVIVLSIEKFISK